MVRNKNNLKYCDNCGHYCVGLTDSNGNIAFAYCPVCRNAYQSYYEYNRKNKQHCIAVLNHK